MTQAGDGSTTTTAGQGGDGSQQQQQNSQQQSSSSGDGQGFAPITSQDEFDKRLTSRLERERAKFADYDDVKKKLQEIEDRDKSDLQKATEAADSTSKERDNALAENARLKAAIKHGLSEEDVAALDGVPADKVDALAARLATVAKSSTRRTSAAGLQSGAGSGQPNTTGKERAAQALRDMRSGR